MATTTAKIDTENKIRSLFDKFSEAIKARDFDAIEAHYTDDVVVFDVPAPLQSKGKAAYRKLWEGWLGMFSGEIGCEFRELNITASDDVAFAHFLSQISNKLPDGTDHGSWVRVTLGYQKVDGKWLASHVHASLPFNGQTSEEDLKP